jgi:hypothetical protein
VIEYPLFVVLLYFSECTSLQRIVERVEKFNWKSDFEERIEIRNQGSGIRGKAFEIRGL